MPDNSNVVNIAGASSRDRLKAEAAQRYAPERVHVPGYEFEPLVRRLKSVEQDELYRFFQDHPNISAVKYNAKQASLGLVDPVLTFDEAFEMDDEWLQVVSGRIDELTTAFRKADAEKGGSEPAPFIQPSSSPSVSPSATAGPSRKSTA